MLVHPTSITSTSSVLQLACWLDTSAHTSTPSENHFPASRQLKPKESVCCTHVVSLLRHPDSTVDLEAAAKAKLPHPLPSPDALVALNVGKHIPVHTHVDSSSTRGAQVRCARQFVPGSAATRSGPVLVCGAPGAAASIADNGCGWFAVTPRRLRLITCCRKSLAVVTHNGLVFSPPSKISPTSPHPLTRRLCC